MGERIKITAGPIVLEAELGDTETAREVIKALPIESTAQTWGDEIYFTIPVQMGRDDTARDVVGMGEIGYWPPGRAFCIFFGPTPASEGNEIRAASAVNIIGRVLGDPTVLKQVKDGDIVRLEKKD
ncbi:cyclophilin-like fold protein [Thermodesulforhabdus norvegica]|uniref:Cyclophilin TM1367-like domain-containing protein n=1 Tax=Thermodesulforhabdus norvegica TaxID=39841 RepID=A0A1I4RD98_9BACT|nr:cyclophilin-like fold protein [Thermodesulforhabdus norvegica]SFM49903.1 hypothetical protein SAMN05660836_00542 [Thermodesulforhabdus norvegica]